MVTTEERAISRLQNGARASKAFGVAPNEGGVISVRFPLDMPMDEMTERRLAGRYRAAG